MQLGNELKRDFCPLKYCSQGSVFAESIPTLIAVVIVAFFSGNLFNASGMDLAITLVIEIIFAALLYGFTFIMFRGMKKRLAETYISVCENGICGICPQNGFKNREFSLLYSEITKVIVKGERLFLYSRKENVVLTLQNAGETSALIQTKISEG